MVVETVQLAPGYVVSRLAKGNWQLAAKHGEPYSQDAAIEDMRRFVEAGVNAFDCADHYVGVEETIGRFRARYPELGARLRVSTKYTPDQADLRQLTQAKVQLAVDTSLKRLGVEQLDLVQFHWWDYEVPGYLQALHWLAELQASGKVAHLGVTNFDVPRLREIVGSGITLLTNQLQYSVLDHRPQNGMVAFAQAHNIKLLCYGTLAGGFLSERWLGQSDPVQPYANRSLVKYRLIIEEFGGWSAFQALLQTLSRIAHKHQSSIAAVAARYVLDKPQVACALVGARDAKHMEANLQVFALQLDDEDRAQIAVHTQQAPGPHGDCYELERDKHSIHSQVMQMNQNTHGVPSHVVLAPDVSTIAKRPSGHEADVPPRH